MPSTQTTTAPAPDSNLGFFSSPGDLQTAANEANRTVSAIDGAVQAAGINNSGQPPQNWIDSWDAFKLVWQSFFSSHFQGQNVTAEWFTSDLEGQLKNYQQQIASWASQAQSYGISVPGGVATDKPSDPLGFLPSGGTVIGALALTAIIVALWKMVH